MGDPKPHVAARRVDRITWWTALRESELPPTARLVALVLSTYMDPTGARCWPAQTTVAQGAGLGRRTVQRAIEQLRTDGFLEVHRYAGPGAGRGQRPHIYVPAVPDLCATDGAQKVQTSAPPSGAEEDATSAPSATTSAPLTTDQCATGGARPHQDLTRDLTNDDAHARARDPEPVDNSGVVEADDADGITVAGALGERLPSVALDVAAIDTAAGPWLADGWDTVGLVEHLAEVYAAAPRRSPNGFLLSVLKAASRPNPPRQPRTDEDRAAARGRNAASAGVTPDVFAEQIARELDDDQLRDVALAAHREARRALGLSTVAEATSDHHFVTRRF